MKTNCKLDQPIKENKWIEILMNAKVKQCLNVLTNKKKFLI